MHSTKNVLKNIHGEHEVNTEAISCCTQTAIQKAPNLLAPTLSVSCA